MQIKFKRVMADADVRYQAAFEMVRSITQKKTKDIDTLNYQEIWIDNELAGYIATNDYNHKASKSRMLCIVELSLFDEIHFARVLDEFIRKNKKDYYEIYTWQNEKDIAMLDLYKEIGVFLVADPTAPFRITKDYTRDGLIKLDGRYAVLFYEDGERYKGSEIDV